MSSNMTKTLFQNNILTGEADVINKYVVIVKSSKENVLILSDV